MRLLNPLGLVWLADETPLYDETGLAQVILTLGRCRVTWQRGTGGPSPIEVGRELLRAVSRRPTTRSAIPHGCLVVEAVVGDAGV